VRYMRLLSLVFLVTGLLYGQPFIYYRGVVNAASALPYGVAAGAIAQGSLFTIYGRNLGPSNGVSASSYPLGTTLANVSLMVSDGTTKLNPLPVYVSAGQINAIMPSNTPLGSVSLRVSVNGAISNPMPIRVAANSPGIFTARETGVGPAIVQNFVSATQTPVNSLQGPASPGQTEILWATGLGPISSDTTSPVAGNLPVKVEVFVGAEAVPVQYSGRAPGFAGTDQVNFQIPNDAPSGCWVPVYLRVAGNVVSNVATIAITPDGSPCAALESRAGAALIQGGRFGFLAPLRSDILQSSPNSPLDLRADFLIDRMAQEAGGMFAFNPLFSLPPPGTCTAYAGGGDWLTADPAPDIQPSVSPLAAGPFTVSSTNSSATFSAPYSPLALGYLGSVNPAISSKDTTLLAPGQFTLQSQGGTDLPGFQLAFTMISPVTWTNRDQISTINRSTGLTVNWSGAQGQTIAVVGGSTDLPTDVSGVFVCMAAPGANAITVPPAILANLPPGRGNPVRSKAVLFLVQAGTVAPFTATGLDTGLLSPIYISGNAVTVQ
jgi:uncharacterized protein (TIGR03437 family)